MKWYHVRRPVWLVVYVCIAGLYLTYDGWRFAVGVFYLGAALYDSYRIFNPRVVAE